MPVKTYSQPAKPSVAYTSRALAFIDRRPWAILPIWILAYFVVLWRPAHRPLWYDELFTYYVSMSPTWTHFVGSVLHADLNPPLGYFFFRASMAQFGDTPFGGRIPSMLAFLAASLIASHLISRRLGGSFGLLALGIFWSFPWTSYAVELRPYALMLAFFAAAALCWTKAIESRGWTFWHAGLAVLIGMMFLTHCFSPPFAASIGAAELGRTVISRRVRKIDYRVWTAILAPLSVLPAYLPLVRNAHGTIFPYAFQASGFTFVKFYATLLIPLAPIIAFLGMAWFSGKRKRTQDFSLRLTNLPEIAFLLVAFLAPVVTITYCIFNKIPFWDRYGICAILPATLFVTALVAKVVRRNSAVALVLAVLILVLFCWTRPGTAGLTDQFDNPSTAYRTIRPELPFVAASGLTFLEMDHRESPEFIHRLYYLTDREAATQFHATIFEGLPKERPWFPIRANMTPFREFTAQHRQFLVLATPGYPEDWLLPKLIADGAQIRLIQETKTGYRDRNLYEVTLNPVKEH
jgi:4-amino-4-deoxy-L-arabinose transferase-like glycosyltransferase